MYNLKYKDVCILCQNSSYTLGFINFIDVFKLFKVSI